ncbi:MAG: phosphate acetyltransferase [Clostridia bacterium]|nr:phosphate acetyltransferase [Clostridia bacterium]
MDIKGINSAFENDLLTKAQNAQKTIVLPEAGMNEQVMQAGIMAAENKIAKMVLLVSDNKLTKKFNVKESEYLKVVNITNSDLTPVLQNALYLKRKEKGVTLEGALELLKNPIYFATMMVELSLVDGQVGGAEFTTADALRPALQIIKGKTKESLISSYMIMISDNKEFGENGVVVLSDCGLNIDPTADHLKQICFDTVKSATTVANISVPRVALLSYSTKGSADGDSALKVREATNLILAQNPNFIVDGEFQFDSAVVPSVCAKKAPGSSVDGKANILIFPDLQSGNISYKIMQRFAGFKCIGPITQGFRKPVNDLSRGADANEILRAIAITALQCE